MSAGEVLFATITARRTQRVERRSYPRRCGYLEDAAMRREMHRL
jgi:hypothetical protein